METIQNNKRTWVWLAVLLALFLLISFYINSKQPKDYPDYVSESPAPSGTKAFFTYLEEELVTVATWEKSPELLPKEDKGQILFMVEPYFVPESDQMNEYITYMEAGNTIFLIKNNPEGLFDVNVRPSMTHDGETTVVKDKRGTDYQATVTSYMRLNERETDEILLEDEAGVIALDRTFDEGQLIVVNSPDWLTNDMILEEDHIELLFTLLNLESDTEVLVDESIHGSAQGPSTATIYPKWILVFGLQVALLTLFWLWYQGKRFGPMRVPREATIRFSNEQTTALAAWFQRGKRYQDALIIQADYVKLLLQEKWGIAYRKPWQASSEQIARRSRQRSTEEVEQLTQDLTHLLNKESINKQEYLAWSKKLDRLQREVEEE